MAKAPKKRSAAASAPRSRKRPSSLMSGHKDSQRDTRAGTKQSTAIGMLRSPNGTTIDALMKATGWQQHSIRGFLAGVVRNRLKLNLISTIVEGRRVYRVTGEDDEKPVKAQAGRHKS
jgi:hypothetical protein